MYLGKSLPRQRLASVTVSGPPMHIKMLHMKCVTHMLLIIPTFTWEKCSTQMGGGGGGDIKSPIGANCISLIGRGWGFFEQSLYRR